MKIRKYLPAIGVSYLLFFVLAFVTGLYSPLGVIVKFQFGISMGAAQLGTLANFLAYAFMGIPSGIMLKRYGYKLSALAAATIGIIGVGLLLFSGYFEWLWMYYLGAFVAGFSMCMLNTVINPLLNMIGGGGNRGNQLIQLGGAMNSLAATFGPFILGMLMGRSVRNLPEGAHPHFLISDANPVFFIIIGIFALAILVLLFANIPEPEHVSSNKKALDELLLRNDKHTCFHFRHFVLGAVAIFLYTGVEVGIANMTNVYLIHEVGVKPHIAGLIVSIYWFFMFVGRLAGGYLGSKFSSSDMLSFSSMAAMILLMIVIFTPEKITIEIGRYSLGNIPVNVMFIVLTGLFTSVMWGNIFNMAVEGLGKYVPVASGFFMMMVCGGGVIPFLQGLLADFVGCRASFWLLFICIVYLLYYASAGYKNVNKNIQSLVRLRVSGNIRSGNSPYRH